MTTAASIYSPTPLSPDSAASRRRDVVAMVVGHYPDSRVLRTVWPEEANPRAHIMSQRQQTVDATVPEPAGEPTVAITAEAVEGGTAGALAVAVRGAEPLVLGQPA